MNSHDFIITLDMQIDQKHLLKNPFYIAWSKGELSLKCLQEYAKEYYQHVRAFPTYLSALHSHTEDMPTRKLLLQNLTEEEAGSPNHPELWRMFAKGLGVSDDELDSHQASPEMQNLIHTFKQLCLEGTVSEGLAALYSYESQIPAICHSKIAGLKNHYGLHDPKTWAYFSVHIAADEEHAEVEKQLLAKHFNPRAANKSLAASKQVVDHLWNFLLALCKRFDVPCHCN